MLRDAKLTTEQAASLAEMWRTAESGEEQPARDVRVGDTFRLWCALGLYESRVLRPHREPGYFETVFERWITDVPAFRQNFVGSIAILSRAAILSAKYAD